jgi:hypothetical protein
METSDERLSREETTERPTQAESERAPAEKDQASDHVHDDVRQHEQRLRELAEQLAATEDRVAATLHGMAERALREGRLKDAKRLEDEAAAAVQGAEREHRQAEWRPSIHTPREPDPAGAEHRQAVAQRAREAAAQRRDEAARGRDEVAWERDDAARQRDEAATRRDQQTVDRGVAAGRRDAAAEERAGEEAEWARRPAASAGGAPSEARAEQVAIDKEVGATYRRFAEDNRRRASADRAHDVGDRAEAARNRLAADEDREAARIDREEAGRDRAAAEADREQEDIDRETRRD